MGIIKTYCQITVHDLQNLVNTNTLRNVDTMALFLESFCASTAHAYVCPQLLPLLQTDGWDGYLY